MFVSAAHKIEVDNEYVQEQHNQKSFKQLQELCEKNRLRKKFPQIDKSILQGILNKWLLKQ